MSTTEENPNQIRLLEIYGTITIATVLLGGLALIYIIHVIKVQRKQKEKLKLRKRQLIRINNTDQLLYGPNLLDIQQTGIF